VINAICLKRRGKAFHPFGKTGEMLGQLPPRLRLQARRPVIFVPQALYLALEFRDLAVRLLEVIDKDQRRHQQQPQIPDLADLAGNLTNPLVETARQFAQIGFLPLLAADGEVAAIELYRHARHGSSILGEQVAQIGDRRIQRVRRGLRRILQNGFAAACLVKRLGQIGAIYIRVSCVNGSGLRTSHPFTHGPRDTFDTAHGMVEAGDNGLKGIFGHVGAHVHTSKIGCVAPKFKFFVNFIPCDIDSRPIHGGKMGPELGLS
jgi:hypothetical protein